MSLDFLAGIKTLQKGEGGEKTSIADCFPLNLWRPLSVHSPYCLFLFFLFCAGSSFNNFLFLCRNNIKTCFCFSYFS